ncbi:MAG: molecular chaperone DnaJ, partial [Veillonella sp.]|nr:molecular chaperone DnaJ [Veillonella sp.]
RLIDVKIPAGVDSGSRLRVAGEGEPGENGGPKGDLYVYIYVRAHREFERSGNDVVSHVNISFAQAALGATVRVDTLDGKLELKIPEGTQTGTAFRIKGHGIPFLRNPKQRGDHHVVVTVQTPKKLNDKQRELLLRFAQEGKEEVEQLNVKKGLFDKIKEAFE